MNALPYEKIPEELKAYKNWVLWKLEKRVNRKGETEYTKPPYSVRGRKASTTTPATWAAFDDAITVYESGGYDGIGFVFTNTPYVGIDCDDCVADSRLSPIAADIAKRLASYTEYSQSGEGIHIISRAQLPSGERKNTKLKLEMYGHGSPRYFVMTGNVYADNPIRECQLGIDTIHAQYITKRERTQAPMTKPTGLTPSHDLEWAIRHDEVMIPLWRGDRPHGDESSDDMALMNKLAYYCAGDETATIAAFRRSPHCQSKDTAHRKKCGRKDYLPRTFKEAMNSVEQTASTPLETLNGNELLNKVFAPLKFIIAGFLHEGFSILSAPSKYGKSWMVLDMLISVATETPFLGFETVKGGVLYLALEDSFRRAQDRLKKVSNGRGNLSNLYIAIKAGTIDNGLKEQIDAHMTAHPDTTFIVVDVLQRIRSGKGRGGKNAYEYDNEELAKLKAIGDAYGVCLLAVHHMTKWKDPSDPFNNFSGSVGMQSVIDQGFALTRENRESDETILHTMGRELASDKYVIRFNPLTFRWDMVNNVDEVASAQACMDYMKDPVVKTIKGLLGISPQGIELTASEFSEHMVTYANCTMDDRAIGKAFERLKSDLFQYDKIVHYKSRNAKNRTHQFRKVEPKDEMS